MIQTLGKKLDKYMKIVMKKIILILLVQEQNRKIITKNMKIVFFAKKKLTKWSRKDSVRDHCHITGKYRGAVHNSCNLMLKISPKITQIPVVFYNLRGYDSHLIVQAISKIQETSRNSRKKIKTKMKILKVLTNISFHVFQITLKNILVSVLAIFDLLIVFNFSLNHLIDLYQLISQKHSKSIKKFNQMKKN